jgi:Phage integrase, N-terminal SAM-like domain
MSRGDLVVPCRVLSGPRAGARLLHDPEPRPCRLFDEVRRPSAMGEAEVSAFLSHLATEGRVAASTQNQALSALLFLYRDVYRRDLEWMGDVVRARRPARLLEVLTQEEVTRLLRHRKASDLPHAAQLVRDAPAGGGLRHQDHPGTPGPQGREHDDDLHARPQQERARCTKSPGRRAMRSAHATRAQHPGPPTPSASDATSQREEKPRFPPTIIGIHRTASQRIPDRQKRICRHNPRALAKPICCTHSPT